MLLQRAFIYNLPLPLELMGPEPEKAFNLVVDPFTVPGGPISPVTRISKFLEYVRGESTFFRIHLFAFTFIPLISSGIFYACNGRFRVHYIDSLFLCYSAMTVTGLSTVNLSTLTVWQQVILYLLMMIVSFLSKLTWTKKNNKVLE